MNTLLEWNSPIYRYLLHNILLPCHNPFQSVFACTFFPTLQGELQGMPTKVFKSTLKLPILNRKRDKAFYLPSSMGRGRKMCLHINHFPYNQYCVRESSQAILSSPFKDFHWSSRSLLWNYFYLDLVPRKKTFKWTSCFFFFSLSPGHSWFFTQSVIMFPLNVVLALWIYHTIPLWLVKFLGKFSW